MLRVFLGTDRTKINAALGSARKGALYITDAHALDDLASAISANSSLFGGARTVVLDGILGNDDMRPILMAALAYLALASDEFFIIEQTVDADTKRKLQKHVPKLELFDAFKKKEYPSVFKLADHLKRADKKNLWVAYQRELAQDNVPEAIHGVLFWGAKQYLLSARSEKDVARGRRLVAALAELPHESRRRGEELEYALERFILSVR